MNHLVCLDAQAGELEKILSGIKTMLLKEFDPAHAAAHRVNAGDSLYFLRDKDNGALRVRATVSRVIDPVHHDLSQVLKEEQPRLQLTEDQYNDWSTKAQVLLVEFNSAHKIPLITVAWKKIKDQGSWIAFRQFSCIMP